MHWLGLKRMLPQVKNEIGRKCLLKFLANVQHLRKWWFKVNHFAKEPIRSSKITHQENANKNPFSFFHLSFQRWFLTIYCRSYLVPRRKLSASVLNLGSGWTSGLHWLPPAPLPLSPTPLSISLLPLYAIPQATLHWDRTNFKKALFIVFY